MMDIKTFVFLDLETTGLPLHENNTTKITELCLVSVQAEHILLGAVPRVKNKLNLCFNPWKLIQHTAQDITGLSNELLENQSSFDDGTYNLLLHFLERLQKPICFVAHNGNGFDFPILRTHIDRIKKEFLPNIFCIDSLLAFRELLANPDSAQQTITDEVNITVPSNTLSNSDVNNGEGVDEVDLSDDWDTTLVDEVLSAEKKFCGNTSNGERQRLNETTPVKNICAKPTKLKGIKLKTRATSHIYDDKSPNRTNRTNAKKSLNFENISPPSFKLEEVYKRLLQKTPVNMHYAEVDVLMMLECSVQLGDKFINWANQHAILFNQVPKMVPGQKIAKLNV